VKALFFAADSGYVDGRSAPVTCTQGADCVYQRYLAAGRAEQLEAAGVTDAASFADFYWEQQGLTAGTLFLVTLVGGLGGGLLYAAARPKATARTSRTEDGPGSEPRPA
jgi:hypothetical protein